MEARASPIGTESDTVELAWNGGETIDRGTCDADTVLII
jgi:hypothetical protein